MDFDFTAAPYTVAGRHILRLPAQVSQQLPARSMALGDAHVLGQAFLAQLEPDGNGGHFMLLPERLAASGQPLHVSVTLSDPWPEPEMPAVFTEKVRAAGLDDFWRAVTPKAKWEWFRWLRDTKSETTRAKRLDTAIDKLSKGMRRPCCFNTAACTLPEVCKSGVLIG